MHHVMGSTEQTILNALRGYNRNVWGLLKDTSSTKSKTGKILIICFIWVTKKQGQGGFPLIEQECCWSCFLAMFCHTFSKGKLQLITAEE